MTAPQQSQRPISSTAPVKRRLGDVLIQRGLITAEQLSNILAIQDKRKKDGDLFLLGELVLEQKLISEETLFKVIREVEVPAPIPGREYPYIASIFKSSIGEKASADIQSAQKNNQDLHMFDIIDKNIDFLRFATQKRLIVNAMKPFIPNLVVGYPEKISVKLEDGKQVFYYAGERVTINWLPKLNERGKQVIFSRMEYTALKMDQDGESSGQHESKGTMGGELPYSIHDMIADACIKNASDVHIVPKNGDFFVFFRIHGVLQFQSRFSVDRAKGQRLIYLFKNMGAAETPGQFLPEDTREIKDTRITLSDTCGGVDLRVVVIPTYDGNNNDEELIARIIRRTGFEKKSLLQQGYYPKDAEIIKKAFWRQGGLFLTSGKTNSGKTTLNNQLLITDNERKWETIEDPKEYSLPNKNICQHQTFRPKEGFQVGFNELVTAFKRGDPDGVFIGEIRQDKNLIRSVIEASHAGQLVMATVHIGSAFDIFDALVEVFDIPLYTAVRLVLYSHNQSLVSRLCDKCRVEDKDKLNYAALNNIKDELPYAVKDELDDFLRNKSSGPITYVAKKGGCHECNGTGYAGRTPIYEYFYPDVSFIKWMIDTKPDRYAIEERSCRGNAPIGVNKLQTFLRKLKDGQVECSPQTLRELM